MADALKKAKSFLDEAKLSDADASVKKAIDAFTKSRDKAGLAEALSVQIYLLAIQDKRKEAKEMAKEELSKCREDGDTMGEAFMLYSLARVYADRMGSHGREVAAKSATDALAIFRELGDKAMQAECLTERAYVHIKVMDHSKYEPEKRSSEGEACIAVAEEAITLYKELGDKDGEAKALNCIMAAKANGDLGDDWDTIGKSAQEMHKDVGTSRQVALDTYLMASLYYKKEMYSESAETAKNAIAMWKDAGDDIGYLGASYALCAHAHIKLEQLQEATELCKGALEYFGEKQDKQGEAIIRGAMVTLKFTEEEKDAAAEESELALGLIRGFDEKEMPGVRPKRWEAEMLHNAARIHLDNKNVPKAVESATKALKIFQKLKDVVCEADVHHTLSIIYSYDESAKGKKESLKSAIAMRKCFKKRNDLKNMGVACFAVFEAQLQRGKAKDAIKAITEAIALFQQADDSKREAFSNIKLSEVYRLTKDIPKALVAANAALKISREINDKDGESHALDVIYKLEHPTEEEGGESAAAKAQEAEVAESMAVGAEAAAQIVALDFADVAGVILEGAKQVVTEDDVEFDTALMDAGMDSLTSVAFRNGLMTGFGGMNLPSTLMFDYPTVRQIADYIVDRSTMEAIALPKK